MTREQAVARATDLMRHGYHSGPSVLQVMWETTDLGSEDLLWASTNFMGGLAGRRDATCGALSGAGIYIGLRHRVPLSDKPQADAARKRSREQTTVLVEEFRKRFGHITCEKLVGIDFSDAAAVKEYRESGKWMDKCCGYLAYVVEAVYGMEEGMG